MFRSSSCLFAKSNRKAAGGIPSLFATWHLTSAMRSYVETEMAMDFPESVFTKICIGSLSSPRSSSTNHLLYIVLWYFHNNFSANALIRAMLKPSSPRSVSSEESVTSRSASCVPSLRPRSSTCPSLCHDDAGGLERDLVRDLVLELARFLRGHFGGIVECSEETKTRATP